MGGLRTSVTAVCMVLATPAAADGAEGLLRRFADCTGRYSAQVEHLWAVDGPASEAAARRRDTLADLTEAALPRPDPDWTARAMAWRIEAKAAQRQLLAQATYGRAGTDADRARTLAQGFLGECDRLLAGY
jgi:hypothetical protein